MKPTKTEARAFLTRVLVAAMHAPKAAPAPSPELDAAVSRVMAFRSFAELEAAQRDHGYVPTLRTDAYRGKRNASSREDVLTVRAALRDRGLKSWPERVEGES
jgi:hypothetical protein